jgi:ribosomal protein L19
MLELSRELYKELIEIVRESAETMEDEIQKFNVGDIVTDQDQIILIDTIIPSMRTNQKCFIYQGIVLNSDLSRTKRRSTIHSICSILFKLK